MLEVACRRCGRHGGYGTARLVRRYGAGMGLPDVRGVLAGDCPHQAPQSIYGRCEVHFP